MGFSKGTHTTGQIRPHLMLCKMITSISGGIYFIGELALWLCPKAYCYILPSVRDVYVFTAMYTQDTSLFTTIEKKKKLNEEMIEYKKKRN